MATVFKNGFEPHGGICSRIAADDFAVLYPAALQKSEELKSIRRRACPVPGLHVPISFSIGRYLISDPAMSPSAMYDRAMIAAPSVKGGYDAKIALYDESMRDPLLREQTIVNEMETALNGNQFELWHPPQCNHSTGALIGAEALVRWQHPVRGLIAPGIFIPVFEQNGFIYELDKYVWKSACQYLRSALDAGNLPLPVSVNISRHDIFREDFVSLITGLIETYHLPVNLLRREVTESAFAESGKPIVNIIRQLTDFGFTLEIDDFSNGYSSLNTLKSVPAQVVKLDMRFWEDDDGSDRSGNIIESIVRMTKWLGMSVIAEGVEEKARADFLNSIGCSYVQGYLYAKPMSEHDYRQLCANAGKEEQLLTLETVENPNNNAFRNPKSMDTLLFNSYVGAACIYEYHQGELELLRATEKFSQLIGTRCITIEDALKINWTSHLDADSREKIDRDLKTSYQTK